MICPAHWLGCHQGGRGRVRELSGMHWTYRPEPEQDHSRQGCHEPVIVG